MRTTHQDLPTTGPEREALRNKGQFWTPPWVADAMVQYALGGNSTSLFDPAVGAGAFFLAAKRYAAESRRRVSFSGAEIDPAALEEARQNGLTSSDLLRVAITDFVANPPVASVPAIVANPPYIRHHRLSAETKSKLKRLALEVVGRTLDGRAGLHIYFLVRALQLLEPQGRLAFIMPADTCEGVFAPVLWSWLAARYSIDAVITFDAEATPFPGVDTNPLVVMIRNAEPRSEIVWARCHMPETDELRQWVQNGMAPSSTPAITACQRTASEALATGLSRHPAVVQDRGPALGEYARVMRGIATGANEYFCLTRERVASLGIPTEFLRTAVGRTRDVPGHELDERTIMDLNEAGRPIYLFSPDGRDLAEFPDAVKDYIQEGVDLGLPARSLIAQRRPWYKMETRNVPPILFAYLGRRNARFILNRTQAVPLTGFLCVYPKANVPVEGLWRVLQHPRTIENLALVGKSYGGGAIKVEPRNLENLPLPVDAVREAGLPVSPSPETHAPQLRMPT